MAAWPTSIRARLTLWFTLVIGIPILGLGAGAYAIFSRTLHDRTDRFVSDALAAFTRELARERDMTTSVAGAAAKTAQEVRFREMQIAVLDSAGNLLAIGEGIEYPGENANAVQADEFIRTAREARGAAISRTLPDPQGGVRVTTYPTRIDGRALVIAAGYPMHEVEAVLDRLLGTFMLVVPLVFAAAATGGYFLSRQALLPLSDMSARASRISAATLHDRLPVPTSDDELRTLATVINDLLDRLEGAFAQQRQFMANASHELRTPTAIMRTESDVTLSQPTRTEGEYRESIGVMHAASQRLTRIVDDLFLLARADAGHLGIQRSAVDLSDIVLVAVRGVHHIAAARGVRLDVVAADETPMHGDPDLLGLLVLNLLDNAVKHSPTGSVVEVAIRRTADQCAVTVADQGAGIPAEAQDRIFERFFRVDVARARVDATATSGAGLGLAIARRMAELHGGTVRLVRSGPSGSEFEARFPASATKLA